MGERILFLGAHLDDAIIAAGATLRGLVEAGCEVTVVCFGNGDEAFTQPGEREASQRRFLEEAVRAHELLGVKRFVCHDVPDFGVEASRDYYRQTIAAIRECRPTVVFGHYWAEYIQHRRTATQSLDAWYQAGWDCSADLGKPWKAERYFHFEVLEPLPEPTHLVDVSNTFEAKMAAWAAFDTAHDHLGSLARQLETRAAYYGAKIGVRYAEAFRRSPLMPEVCSGALELLPPRR